MHWLQALHILGMIGLPYNLCILCIPCRISFEGYAMESRVLLGYGSHHGTLLVVCSHLFGFHHQLIMCYDRTERQRTCYSTSSKRDEKRATKEEGPMGMMRDMIRG
ncbi:hypothetical protein L208DRAFT_654231 [Tricholoma matsutake]|nr:hypothetical protein L208DRAFT_654231 [Tricholoma matsutake 945]